MFDYTDVRKTIAELQQVDAAAADRVMMNRGLRQDEYSWEQWGPIMRPAEINGALYELSQELTKHVIDPRTYHGILGGALGYHQDTDETWKLYLQMAAIARAVNLPQHYKEDVTWHDRKQIRENPGRPFAWCLRECGSFLVWLDTDIHETLEHLRHIIRLYPDALWYTCRDNLIVSCADILGDAQRIMA